MEIDVSVLVFSQKFTDELRSLWFLF